MKTTLVKFLIVGLGLLLAFTSEAQPVTKITAGWDHSLFLKSDGSLWAMGYDNYGQLGDGTNTPTGPFDGIIFPEYIESNATAVAGGAYHSLFLKSDGSLWVMGYNSSGQLGNGNYISTNRPVQVLASNVTAIAAGAAHSLFLKSDGSLWGMGGNNSGLLGIGNKIGTNQPVQILTSNVTAIAAGNSHSLFLKSDGSLWVMGSGQYGQLGDGSNTSTNLPEEIVSSNVTAIAAGANHSLFAKSDGSLWGMGYNQHGELGIGNFINTNTPQLIVASNVTAIAGGTYHSLFLKNDGSLWGMGRDNAGQLGSSSIVVGLGSSTNLPIQIVANSVTAISAGYDDSLFLKSDGSLWGIGLNAQGELGDGTHVNRSSPTPILGAYNQITGQFISSTNYQLSFVGIARTNYALDRASNLSPANWIPQVTNPANSYGALNFTNTPDATANNFWRIRSVP